MNNEKSKDSNSNMISSIPVSVCIPTRNSADTIEVAVKSILNQTHNNINIYVCDNASTDGTEDVIKQIKDSRLHYIYFNEYLDVNYSLVRALSCAKDEIICLYHSDDWYYPNIIELELKHILSDDISAVFGKMKTCDEDAITEIDKYGNSILSFTEYDYLGYLNEALAKGTIFQCPTFMTKKNIIEASRLTEKKMLISDISLWLEIVRCGKVIDLDTIVMNYRFSKKQLSRKIFEKKRTVVSPQYILLDHELGQMKKNYFFRKISIISYLRYLKRRCREVKEICNNTNTSKSILFYAGVKKYRKNDIDEQQYLQALYK